MADFCFILRYNFNFNLPRDLIRKTKLETNEEMERKLRFLIPCQNSDLIQWTGVRLPLPV